MSKANNTLPMQLQANLAGAWKTVLKFDARDTDAYVDVLEGTRLLHKASPDTSFRIATCDRVPVTFSHMGKSTYGIWMEAKRPTA